MTFFVLVSIFKLRVASPCLVTTLKPPSQAQHISPTTGIQPKNLNPILGTLPTRKHTSNPSMSSDAQNQSSTRRSLSGMLRAYKTKKEERRREEAEHNTRLADQRWEVLNMTGGTAQRARHFVCESDYAGAARAASWRSGA